MEMIKEGIWHMFWCRNLLMTFGERDITGRIVQEYYKKKSRNGRIGESSSIENRRAQHHCQEIKVRCLEGENSSIIFHGRVNVKCTFLVDTEVNVSLVSPNFVDRTLKSGLLSEVRLCYLNGKVLLAEEKMESLVEIFLVIANISNDCTLRCDFLSKTGIDKKILEIESENSQQQIGRKFWQEDHRWKYT
ncbi:hypothetical protein V1477_013291 [Vespula maculifrons]|uniref:Uncharacterized protein n=1 Tax=Vespula maculifrons TaxID=7453 RepID=A0ABD2BVH7_VESMC